jgi:hypothetical protein
MSPTLAKNITPGILSATCFMTATHASAVMQSGQKVLGSMKLVSILFACSLAVFAQGRPPNPSPSPDPKSTDRGSRSSDDGPLIGPMEEEMRARRAIKFAEKEYKENLDRAREVAQLGTQLRDSYKQNRSLRREDNKRLERLEKLAKRIRDDAGGSNEETSLDNPPRELEAALLRLAELSEALRKLVEKTPRQVISAAVIDQANVILELIKLVRSFSH